MDDLEFAPVASGRVVGKTTDRSDCQIDNSNSGSFCFRGVEACDI